MMFRGLVCSLGYEFSICFASMIGKTFFLSKDSWTFCLIVIRSETKTRRQKLYHMIDSVTRLWKVRICSPTLFVWNDSSL